MKYSEARCPQEYLEYVLNYWETFCKVNGGLAKAIEEILKINAALVDAVNVLSKELIDKKEVTAQKDSD